MPNHMRPEKQRTFPSEGQSQREMCLWKTWSERWNIACFEGGERGSKAKEYEQFLEARKGKQVNSPRELCQHLDFNPVRHSLNYGLHDCKLMSLCCFKFVC